MKDGIVLKTLSRLGILLGGFAAVTLLVYAAGKFLVPLTDGADKAILAAINPDSYAPGLDEFFRALTDYTNPIILIFCVSWIIANDLAMLAPRFKNLFAALLGVEAAVIVIAASMGKIWPNKTYIGVNVIEVVAFLVFFGGAALLFFRLDRDALRRMACVVWLMLLSGVVADFGATQPIKESVARPRPLNEDNKPWNEQVRVIPDEVLRGRNSFPSGHTSGTFALLTPLFWYNRRKSVRAGLLGWMVLQGVSRVYTAAHFPFCCLMGGVLGFTVGTLIFFTLGGPSLWRGPEKESCSAG